MPSQVETSKPPHMIQFLAHAADVLLVVWAFTGSDDVPHCIDYNEKYSSIIVGTRKGMVEIRII